MVEDTVLRCQDDADDEGNGKGVGDGEPEFERGLISFLFNTTIVEEEVNCTTHHSIFLATFLTCLPREAEPETSEEDRPPPELDPFPNDELFWRLVIF